MLYRSGMMAVCVALLMNSAWAEPSGQHRRWVAELDSDDYDTRVTATEALLRDDTLTPEAVAELGTLATSLEQRHRLRGVARHHLLRRMRTERFGGQGPGSIGVVQTIQIAGEPPADGRLQRQGDRAAEPPVAPPDGPDAMIPEMPRGPGDEGSYTYTLVSKVLPGFPAAGRLRPMDRIIALDGQALGGGADAQRFELLMRRYTAGQTLTLTVRRGDETLDVPITLTNGAALPAMFGQADFSLTPPYLEAWHQFRDEWFPEAESVTAE